MRRFAGRDLIVATHNAGKLAEFRALLAPFGLNIQSAGDLGLAEPIETEDSFIGNARIKAHAAAIATGMPALSDDSGICVEGLGGAPGVLTADWAETLHGRDFGLAMNRTIDALKAVKAPEPWLAQFNCTLVLAWPDGHDEAFEGVMPGRVVWPARGEMGHGYDPIFVPTGFDKTFGEMTAGQKNAISHRTRAFSAMIEGCFT